MSDWPDMATGVALYAGGLLLFVRGLLACRLAVALGGVVLIVPAALAMAFWSHANFG